VIGGKVVDPSGLAAHVGGSFAMATWLAGREPPEVMCCRCLTSVVAEPELAQLGPSGYQPLRGTQRLVEPGRYLRCRRCQPGRTAGTGLVGVASVNAVHSRFSGWLSA